MVQAPHFMLHVDRGSRRNQGEWRFTIRAEDGGPPLVAADCEPDVQGERLELLTVVRGLEALDQPSRVTLVAASGFVRNGIRYGIEQWRQSDWTWECFGEMVPVKNRDLWQRLSRALEFHRVECRNLRLDPPHTGDAASCEPTVVGAGIEVVPLAETLEPRVTRFSVQRWWLSQLRRLREAADAAVLSFAQLGTALLPQPWLK